jgi:hypothetical protein
MSLYENLSNGDKSYINHIRGALILRVVLMHLGLSWFYLPYSSYFAIFFPALFCVSGIVSYYSYRRAMSLNNYVLRRLSRIVITFYVISGLAYVFALALNPQVISIREVVNWLLINPATSDQPYPMGQIWFLRALVILTIFVLPFFYFSRKNIHVLLIPVVISIVLSLVQQFVDIGKYFSIIIFGLNKINLYQPLVNMGYFCFGGWACYSGVLHRPMYMFSMALFAGICSILMFSFQHFSLNLADHSYNQDFFYLTLGYLGIGFIFGFRGQISFVLTKINVLGVGLAFFSTHAFSIFLIHSLYIFIAEQFLGLKGMTNVQDILIKIAFVLAASCISAVPLSYVSKRITNRALSYIDSRSLKNKMLFPT